jgi:hypothetical protein
VKTYLKVKIKSLADEARTIKAEERKWLQLDYVEVEAENPKTGALEKRTLKFSRRKRTAEQLTRCELGDPHPLFFGLRHHRIHVVRPEARAANIAYGFLRGRDYQRIENKAHEAPNWKRVEELVAKFGAGDRRVVMQQFAAWKDAATGAAN